MSDFTRFPLPVPRHRMLHILKMIPLYFILILFVLIFSFPFFHLLVTATRTSKTIFTMPPPMWFGEDLFYNAQVLSQNTFFFKAIYNSVVIAILATTTQIFFCTMTGFAFAMYEFKFKGLLFTIILLNLLLVQRFLNVIPMFKMMVALKWIDTYLPLVIPPIANAFGIFMMTEFIKTGIPMDLMDAARMDGLNGFQILLRIIFPTMTGPIGVMGTVMFITSWNDFMTALVMLPSKEAFTIPVVLHSMNGNLGTRGGHGTIMLATAISVIPLMIVFLIFSRKIIDNFVAGSLKG